MLPNRCSVVYDGQRCVNPPSFTVSVRVDKDQYMVGVTCILHKKNVLAKVRLLQRDGDIPQGVVEFQRLRPVGTDCIRSDPDGCDTNRQKKDGGELLQID